MPETRTRPPDRKAWRTAAREQNLTKVMLASRSAVGQRQMLVVVRSLDGSTSNHDIAPCNTVADVARISGSTASCDSIQFFFGGRNVPLSTPLSELQDACGVVHLVLVSYTDSKKKRRRKRKNSIPEEGNDLLPLPTNARWPKYSLADPGLDDIGDDIHRGVRVYGRDRGGSESGGRKVAPTALTCPTELIGVLKSKYKDQIHYQTIIEGRQGRCIDLEESGIHEALVRCLNDHGIKSLYEHQVEAWKHRGQNFIVTTSTASGKSLCYLMPMLETLREDRKATALLIYPTKALANDQLAKLRAMAWHVLGPECGVDILDGDTPMEDRDDIVQRKPRVIVTNPDFLSISLPHHAKRYRWMFEGLSIVVLDEAHVYKGVFGTHVALLVRRIRRLAALHRRLTVVDSRRLRFYLSSATLSNAAEFASTLVGEEVFVIDRDSSPSSEKLMVIWLPPLMSNSATKRQSPIYQAAVIMAECMCCELTTIAFATTRKLSELVFTYTQDILAAKDETRRFAASLAVYRAGFSPLERRSIESKLLKGELHGVIATNALELGVDIGGMDVSVHLGWQGSRASLLQQAGRTGRRGRKSLAIFVPFDGVLDMYFVRNPDLLFDPGCIEPTVLSLSNSKIVASHLRAAAYEHELDLHDDLHMFGSASKEVADHLITEGELTRLMGDKLAYAGRDLVPTKFELRSIDRKQVSVVDRTTSQVLEAVEAMKAPFVVYPGAVYSKRGVGYLVERVDWSSGIALAVKAPGPLQYYTTVLDCMTVTTKTLLRSSEAQATRAEVSVRFTAFSRRQRKTGLIMDTIPLHDIPEVRFDTMAMVMVLPKCPVPLASTWRAEAVHCCAHAIIAVLPAMMGVGDGEVGAECDVDHCRHITDRLLLYDKHGSSGLCTHIASAFPRIAGAALDCLQRCRCAEGCPGCCHLPSCNVFNKHLSKPGALSLLRVLLGKTPDTGAVQHYEC